MSEEYKLTIDWLFNQVPMFQNVGGDAYKPGLDGVLALSKTFGNPHEKLKSIHVGGTNGKGSVSSLIASVLQESGMKVGLYTSPHLVDFRERIRINGTKIPEDAVVDFINRYRKMDLGLEPSFFELTTVMAFEWFARNEVDLAVVEVGLGGRLDSTNIIMPVLSIITNISFDHIAQLGDTLEKIASEKAGIIKPGVPVVVGKAEGDVARVFMKKAEEEGAPLSFASEHKWFDAEHLGNLMKYAGTPWGDVLCPLTGSCQPENAATVMDALYELGGISKEAVRDGFMNVCRNTGLTGRWSILQEHPRIICDTGHNKGGWQWLGPQLCAMAAEGRLHVVAGFVNDKDVASIIREMPQNASYYWATPSVKRGRDSSSLMLEAAEAGLNGRAFPTVGEAFRYALSQAGDEDTIFVGGSTFVVADLLQELGLEC